MKIYNNADELVREMKTQWNKNLKWTRVWGFIAAICMITIGILCIINPVQTTYFMEEMASIALLIYGFWEIVRYLKRPVFLRTGAGLASGLLNIILAVLLLTSSAEGMIASFGFLLGMDLMMLGFEQLTATSRLHAIGVNSTKWLTADGIFNIVGGIILLIMPLASIAAISVVLSIYLIVGGINLFVICINGKNLKADTQE